MNERILELRTQAAAWVSENHQPQNPNAYSQKEIDQRYLMYEEKFAELIVKECSDILRKEANSNWEGREERLLNVMANWIEKHFGVSE